MQSLQMVSMRNSLMLANRAQKLQTSRSKIHSKLTVSEKAGLAITVYLHSQILNHKRALEYFTMQLGGLQQGPVSGANLVQQFHDHKVLCDELACCRSRRDSVCLPHCRSDECEPQTYSGNESSKFDACSSLILGAQSRVWSRCGQGSTENLDKVKGVIEGQPCRLPQPEGMTGVDSLSSAPETCLGEQSNVPLEVLGSSSNESDGSLEISVPRFPFKRLGSNETKGKARFAPTSVVKQFVGDCALGEGPLRGESNFPQFPIVRRKRKITF